MYFKSISFTLFETFLKKIRPRITITNMEITSMTVKDKPRSSKVQF